jgi:hypothetical protein
VRKRKVVQTQQTSTQMIDIDREEID